MLLVSLLFEGLSGLVAGWFVVVAFVTDGPKGSMRDIVGNAVASVLAGCAWIPIAIALAAWLLL